MRAVIALVVLVAAIIVQYYLANRPIELDVSDPSNKATPATAKSKQDEIVIEGPILDSSRVLFSLRTSSEFVNAHFEKAQLFGSTLKDFQAKSPPAPAGAEAIDFITEDVEQLKEAMLARANPAITPSEPDTTPQLPNIKKKGICFTSVTAEVAASSSLPTEVHFFLPQDSISTRDFYMTVNAELLVRLDTSPEIYQNRINPWTPGCGKYLKVGEWDWHLAKSVEIEILAAANSVLHFTFLQTPESLWKGRNDLFQPFVFGSKPLRAQAVSVNQLSSDGPTTDLPSSRFRASIKKGGNLLDLNHLVLNAEEIRLDFTGKALVQNDGEYLTGDLYDRLKKYRLIAALLAMGDLALIGWVISIFKNMLRAAN